MFGMGRLKAWGGFQVDPRLERNSDLSLLGTCQALG